MTNLCPRDGSFWRSNAEGAVRYEKYPAMLRELICSWWDALPLMAAHGKCGPRDGISVVWNNGLGSSIRALVMADGYWLARRSPSIGTN